MYSKLVSTLLGRNKGQKNKQTVNNNNISSTSSDSGVCSSADSSSTSEDHAPSGSSHAPQTCVWNSCSGVDDPEQDEDQLQSLDMGHKEYMLKWNVNYVGSFPISNTSIDHLSYRLEKFSPVHSRPVSLAVSVVGVKAYGQDEVVLSHSLRRICSVIGRPTMKEVAYIAMEAAGQTYRKKCHVFRCSDVQEVEEIESVLGNAFQAALFAQRGQVTKSQSSVRPVHSTPVATPCPTMSEKRTSSSVFLSRFMSKTNARDTMEDASKAKRKRRPVSAVFSALQRLSSTTTMSNKRMSAYEPSVHDQDHRRMRVNASPVPEEPTPPAVNNNNNNNNNNRLSKVVDTTPPALVYDEKLGEMIYPIDESVQAQLENVNYFVKLPPRELLVRNLLAHPEGAFVVRYSESKKRCLALSVRVPLSYNSSGISHYLIIRNETGYRIKGFPKAFASLQMLITHHSVMAEQLPVPLHFVQWHKDDWNVPVVPVYDSVPEYKENRKSQMVFDENRNTKYFADSEWTTPKRSSRHLEHHRYSRFFDIDQ